jgi:multiple sugar transport system substrate-binding protein
MAQRTQRLLIWGMLPMLLVGILAACGATPPASAPPAGGTAAAGGSAAATPEAPMVVNQGASAKLRVWLFKSFVTDANDLLVEQVQEWAKSKNVEVELAFSTFSDQRQKFVTAIEGNDMPDIGEVDPTGPIRYSSQLLDMSDLAKEIADKNGGMLPNVEPYVNFDGKYLGVPRYGLQSVMYIRKDLMDAKNLKPPTTWDELKTFAAQVQDPSKEIYGFGQTLNKSTDGSVFVQAMLWNFGGGVFDAQGNPAFKTDANKQALQYMTDLIGNAEITPPGVNGWTDSSNNEAYLAGKLAVTLNGASLYYAMTTNKDQQVRDTIAKNTILMPWPAGPNGAFTVSNPNNWVVFKNSKNPELAKDLIRYLEDEKQFSAYLRASVGQAAPVYKKRFNDPFWKSDPNFEAILASMKNSRPFGYPGPVTKAVIEIEGRNLLTSTASQVVSGGSTVDQALDDVSTQVADIVASSQ